MGKNLADVEYKMRMTQDLKDKIVESAKEHNRSMNADIVARLEESFLRNESSAPARSDVKIIHLKNGKKRVIYGKLINNLSLDYTQELDQLRDDIHLSLEVLSGSSFWNSLKFFNKDVLVYKGDNHIDVVDNGKKSLGWLIVEDHITDKFMENNMQKLSKSDVLLNSIIEHNNRKVPHIEIQTAEYSKDKNYIAIRAEIAATSTNRNNLIDYIKLQNCEKIYLFSTPHTAKEYPLFSEFYGPESNLPLLGAIAQVKVQGINTYVIFDGLFLTAQRRPRYLEVEQVLNESILSSKVSFITSSAPFTRHLNTIGAVEELIPLPVKQLTDISRPEFFSLLSNYPEKEM